MGRTGLEQVNHDQHAMWRRSIIFTAGCVLTGLAAWGAAKAGRVDAFFVSFVLAGLLAGGLLYWLLGRWMSRAESQDSLGKRKRRVLAVAAAFLSFILVLFLTGMLNVGLIQWLETGGFEFAHSSTTRLGLGVLVEVLISLGAGATVYALIMLSGRKKSKTRQRKSFALQTPNSGQQTFPDQQPDAPMEDLGSRAANYLLALDGAAISKLLDEQTRGSHSSRAEADRELVRNIGLALRHALSYHTLTHAEAAATKKLLQARGLGLEDLDPDSLALYQQSAIISKLLEGEITPQVIDCGPFCPEPGEITLCYFPDHALALLPRISSWESAWRGTALPVGKGLYWRWGKSAATTALTPGTPCLRSDLLITSRNLHFWSNGDLRVVPLSRISSLAPYQDGVILHLSEALHPILLLTPDPWFLTNLLQNAANVANVANVPNVPNVPYVADA